MNRNCLTLLFCLALLTGATWAQDQVLAQSQGHQLRESNLVPGINFLNFLVQGQITQEELAYLVQESVKEFNGNPAEFVVQLQTFNGSIARAQQINDPVALGKFRQTIIGEFFAGVQQLPANQVPAFIQILFRHVQVTAFDPKTKVALTQQDLLASMVYLKELYYYQGQNVPDQALEQMAGQLVANFTQLDAQTQNHLASGLVVLAVFRANIQQMNQTQQAALAQNYQQNYQQNQGYATNQGSGNTSAAAQSWDNWHNQQSMKIYQDTMESNHYTMMNCINAMGGSDDYWTLNPGY